MAIPNIERPGPVRRTAFETCSFDAGERRAWLRHAFVVLLNHLHLALEAPWGNLSAGRQWLESTFATRRKPSESVNALLHFLLPGEGEA